MSTRLLTILILPTLLLLVGPAPIRAAQQPTEPIKPVKAGDEGKEKLVSKVYQVTDLVIPIQSEGGPCRSKWENGTWMIGGSMPKPAQNDVWKGYSGSCLMQSATTTGTAPNHPEDELINAIKTNIKPALWNDAGGPFSMEYFPLTHALVVNATPDVQELIQDFLSKLRRLQDQEVAIEVKFITLSDALYGRLKTDFEFKDCKDGLITSFDDKQAYHFMEAAQGDRLANVMQAPKITMFNGQASAIRILETKFFATSAVVRWSDEFEAPVAVPTNEPIQFGMEMALQPTISSDQRFVQLNLNFKSTRLEREDVELIPIRTVINHGSDCKSRPACLSIYRPVESLDKTSKAMTEDNEKLGKGDVFFTQFLQKPKIAKVSIERKLNLPEGKTAVLFGWKQTGEVTDAVPVLSKLPYVGKNYQHKRQVPETVLVLVTPRVIVPKEEERATGLPVLPQVVEEVLPMPKPVPAKAAPTASGNGEASDLKTVERVWNGWYKADLDEKNVNELMAKYHKLCAAGKKDAARKVALKALKIDPTCFDRK